MVKSSGFSVEAFASPRRMPPLVTDANRRDRCVLRERACAPALEATMAGQPHGAPRRPSATRLSWGGLRLAGRRQATGPLSAASKPPQKTADPRARRPLSCSLGETLGPSIGASQHRPQGREGPGMLIWTWRWSSAQSTLAARADPSRHLPCTRCQAAPQAPIACRPIGGPESEGKQVAENFRQTKSRFGYQNIFSRDHFI